jgi:hypothetical protein
VTGGTIESPGEDGVMNLNVLVVPHGDGFRAWTGGLLDLTADGPTPDAAVAALRAVVLTRLPRFEVHTIHLPGPLPLVEPAPDPEREAAFQGFLEELAEYRRIHNTVPDAD